MTNRCLINVEPIEPSGVALTIAELPGLFVFGQTADDARRKAHSCSSRTPGTWQLHGCS
jgi:hypothetical protein